MTRRVVKTIDPLDAKSDFSCGRSDLDLYLRRHALSNDARGIGRTYVLRRGDDDDPDLPLVLGFYTLSIAIIESSQIAAVDQERFPKYPLPVALIGRLAVDARAQGRGFGELLVLDALRRVIDAARILGCLGVVVDAKDRAAESFYSKYDFIPVGGDAWPKRLYLSMSTIHAAFVERPR